MTVSRYMNTWAIFVRTKPNVQFMKLYPTASKKHSHTSFGHWSTWAKITGAHTCLSWSETLWTQQKDVTVLNPPFGLCGKKMYAPLETMHCMEPEDWLPEVSVSVETMLPLSKL